MLYPFLPSLLHDPAISFDHANTVWWRLKYEIFYVTFSVFVLFILPRFKYSLQHSVRKHPELCCSFNERGRFNSGYKVIIIKWSCNSVSHIQFGTLYPVYMCKYVCWKFPVLGNHREDLKMLTAELSYWHFFLCIFSYFRCGMAGALKWFT
jgi:hypothetical protein